MAALTEALTLAQAHGHVRVFVDEGPPMAALLGAVLSAQRGEHGRAGRVASDYLARLVRAFADDATSKYDIWQANRPGPDHPAERS